MRYRWATVFAACLIGVCAVNARMMDAIMATAPPGGGLELPSSTIWRVFLADLWTDYWYAIIPVIWVVCFGVASLMLPSSGATRSLESVETNKPEN